MDAERSIAIPHAGQKWKEPKINKDSRSRQQNNHLSFLADLFFSFLLKGEFGILPRHNHEAIFCILFFLGEKFITQLKKMIKTTKDKKQIGFFFLQLLLLRGVSEGKEVRLSTVREDFNPR
jgi:hypothetical protein